MKRIFCYITGATLLLLGVTGCLDTETDTEFTEAIPRKDDLIVRIGANDTATQAATAHVHKLLDPYAQAGCENCCIERIDDEEYYVDGEVYKMTRDAQWHINGSLAVSLAWIWTIVNLPSTEEIDDGYSWGPWQEELSRVRFKFEMKHSKRDGYVFELLGQNINELEDNWTKVVFGEFLPVDVPHAVSGTIVIDYGAIHTIDTAHPSPASGQITYTFDVTQYPYTLNVEFDDFEFEKDKTLSATYSYRRLNENMAGELSFNAEADYWPELSPDGVAEQLEIVSRWDETGKGKGEVTMAGGSIANSDEALIEATLTECWADSTGLFYTTYQSAAFLPANGDAAITETVCGAPANCPVF